MVRMLVTKAVRHQHFNRVAEQLGAGVAKELFGLRIDQHHTAVLGHQRHRVGRRLE
jgi:hypothetical protein